MNEAIAKAISIVGSQSELAERIGVSCAAIQNVKSGLRPCPARWAPLIEEMTNRAVRAEELCPNVRWSVIRKNR